MKWLNRRRWQRRKSELASEILTVRKLTVAALNRSGRVDVMQNLLAAVDHLDAALALLVPGDPPLPPVVHLPVLTSTTGGPNAH